MIQCIVNVFILNIKSNGIAVLSIIAFNLNSNMLKTEINLHTENTPKGEKTNAANG